MHNFKKLKVWEKSMDLAENIYLKTTDFPIEEKYSLTSQLRRCAVSIPSNIAEGSSRSSDKDFSRFLTISLGSSFELETQLILSKRLNYLHEEQFNSLQNELDEIQKMLIVFNKKINVN